MPGAVGDCTPEGEERRGGGGRHGGTHAHRVCVTAGLAQTRAGSASLSAPIPDRFMRNRGASIHPRSPASGPLRAR